MYLFFIVLGLCRCAWTFSNCGERGLLPSCGAQASLRGGFSCCRGRALGARASAVAAHGLSSCSLRALGRVGFSRCGTQASLLCGMWNLPGPGIEPLCPALAVRFLSTVPPGKSFTRLLNIEAWDVWTYFCYLLQHGMVAPSHGTAEANHSNTHQVALESWAWCAPRKWTKGKFPRKPDWQKWSNSDEPLACTLASVCWVSP